MVSLKSEERRRLALLADQLIPADGEFPCASQAGVAEAGVDRVLSLRPDLVDPLREILKPTTWWPADAAGPVGGFQHATDLPAATLRTVGEVVAGAYFLNDRVRDLIGYHGRQEILVRDLPDYADLIGPVVERGSIYRDDA